MSSDLKLNLIAAVGRSGQLGIKGRLPWHDGEDLEFFRASTMGHIVLMGNRTAEAVPPLPGRHVVRWSARNMPVAAMLQELHGLRDRLTEHHKPDKPIQVFVAGGAHTYQAFLPYVRRVYLTHITYDGPADTFMPPLWEFNRVEWQRIADAHARTIATLTQQAIELTKEVQNMRAKLQELCP